MDEAVKNLVMLVWTFSAINMNIEEKDINTLLLSEEKPDVSTQSIVDLHSQGLQFEKDKIKQVKKILENKTQAG